MKSVKAIVDLPDYRLIRGRVPDYMWNCIEETTINTPAADLWLTVSGPVRIAVRERYMDNAGS